MKIIDLGIIHNYRSYQNIRKGIFHIDINEYGPDGWIQKEKEYTIIGEDDESYVYELKKTECGYWNEKNEKWTEKYILPLGVHKSRLLKWKLQQLELFNYESNP